jgi:hypothetical protein
MARSDLSREQRAEGQCSRASKSFRSARQIAKCETNAASLHTWPITKSSGVYSGEAVNGVLHGRAYECRVFEAHNYVHHKDFGPRLTFFHEYCLDVPWP